MIIDTFRAPFTNVCPSVGSHWHGKRTASVYDKEGQKVVQVPSVPFRSYEDAIRLADELCTLLNERKAHMKNIKAVVEFTTEKDGHSSVHKEMHCVFDDGSHENPDPVRHSFKVMHDEETRIISVTPVEHDVRGIDYV